MVTVKPLSPCSGVRDAYFEEPLFLNSLVSGALIDGIPGIPFLRKTIWAALEEQGALLLTNVEFRLINLPAPLSSMFFPTGFRYMALSAHLKEKTCQDLFLC